MAQPAQTRGSLPVSGTHGKAARGTLNCERTFLFLPQSMNEGHPDELCDPAAWHELDEGSDAVLYTFLRQDPEPVLESPCDTATKDGIVTMTGEIKSARILYSQKGLDISKKKMKELKRSKGRTLITQRK